MTLGQAIRAVKLCGTLRDGGPKDVRYDFGRFTVNGLHSYRGYYDQLSLGFREPSTAKPPTTPEQLLKLLEDAVGQTFQGYKGGDYEMDEGTKLWVANYGDCHDTAVDRITEELSELVIHTRYDSAP